MYHRSYMSTKRANYVLQVLRQHHPVRVPGTVRTVYTFDQDEEHNRYSKDQSIKELGAGRYSPELQYSSIN
jgi:acyl dehydratase